MASGAAVNAAPNETGWGPVTGVNGGVSVAGVRGGASTDGVREGASTDGVRSRSSEVRGGSSEKGDGWDVPDDVVS
jgi:hypothetical protein